MKIFPFLLIIVVLLACKQEKKTDASSSFNSIEGLDTLVPYNFDLPESSFILDPALKEISGLGYNINSNHLLAHNDEQGYIFELDLSSGKITDKIKFGKKNDYEGISYASGKIYIAKHTGKIFVYDPSTKTTKSYKTALSARNDVEGLCLDKKNNALLLACKGQPLTKEKHKKEKCIYAFDLATNTLEDAPRLTIKDDLLVDWVKNNYKYYSKKDLNNKIRRVSDFSPSGLSFTNDQSALYILSARGSTLLIYDEKLELSTVHFLNSKTIPQPEGICFDKFNNLYISTEGQGFSGKIFKFEHHDK